MLNAVFKSVIDQDNTAIVICNTKHEIIYMNPMAIGYYSKWGGVELIGKSLLGCHGPVSGEKIKAIVEWFEKSESNNSVHTFYNEKQNKDGYMIALRDSDNKLIGYYEKHEFRTADDTPFYHLP